MSVYLHLLLKISDQYSNKIIVTSPVTIDDYTDYIAFVSGIHGAAIKEKTVDSLDCQ